MGWEEERETKGREARKWSREIWGSYRGGQKQWKATIPETGGPAKPEENLLAESGQSAVESFKVV